MLTTTSPPASLQRLWFPASSGLGFNYLNCNATGEREAGNLPGDAPAALLHHRPAGGSRVGGHRVSPYPERKPPGLLGLGGCIPVAPEPCVSPVRGSV